MAIEHVNVRGLTCDVFLAPRKTARFFPAQGIIAIPTQDTIIALGQVLSITAVIGATAACTTGLCALTVCDARIVERCVLYID
jgi:hypothetical protein